mmetsp:Transcript_9917/g.19558  ORF Transcript_9917/g.19558 Transcript_9917/m.19558 type:complete len:244 (-) Transcript_9917:1453-2184(-)
MSVSLVVTPRSAAIISSRVSFVKVLVIFVASASVTSLWRGMDMVGVFNTLDAVIIISRSRGIPRVTFAPDPAKWNVFRVICVEGSPIDWAAIAPTASPGSTKAEENLAATKESNSSFETLLLFIAFFNSSFSCMILDAFSAIRSDTHAPLLPILCVPFAKFKTGSEMAGFRIAHVLEHALFLENSTSKGTFLTFSPSFTYLMSKVPLFLCLLIIVASNHPSQIAPLTHFVPTRSFLAWTKSPI